MDLSKAFDTINYQLLSAKLKAYSFGKNTLDLVHSYYKIRKQRVKRNTTFTTWTDLIGPLLFNIDLNDLFFFLQDKNIYNFSDDTTTFVCDETL